MEEEPDDQDEQLIIMVMGKCFRSKRNAKMMELMGI